MVVLGKNLPHSRKFFTGHHGDMLRLMLFARPGVDENARVIGVGEELVE